MSPQVRVLRAALWRSLSSEGVPLRCGLQTWGLLCEVCVVLCSGRGRDTVSLVTRGNSVFVAANRVLKRGRSENDVVFRKTLCCEARPHLPDKKDKAGRERVTCTTKKVVITHPTTRDIRQLPFGSSRDDGSEQQSNQPRLQVKQPQVPSVAHGGPNERT